MPKFKEGDKVVRIGPSKRNVIKGGVYIVDGPVYGTSVRGYMYLRDHGYGWDVCKFKRYEEPVMTNETKKPHVHAECIKAWADGAAIQRKLASNEWLDIDTPNWYPGTEYRIKPEPKPDVVAFSVVHNVYYDENTVYVSNAFKKNEHPKSNLKLTFDGETGKLKKAEVI